MAQKNDDGVEQFSRQEWEPPWEGRDSAKSLSSQGAISRYGCEPLSKSQGQCGITRGHPFISGYCHYQDSTMTIVQRLLILVGAAIAGLIALAGINYYQMNRVFEAANYGNANSIPSIMLLNHAMEDFSRVRVRGYRAALSSDPVEIEKIHEEAQSYRQKVARALGDYEKLVSDEQDRKLLEADKALLNEYNRGVDEVFEV